MNNLFLRFFFLIWCFKLARSIATVVKIVRVTSLVVCILQIKSLVCVCFVLLRHLFEGSEDEAFKRSLAEASPWQLQCSLAAWGPAVGGGIDCILPMSVWTWIGCVKFQRASKGLKCLIQLDTIGTMAEKEVKVCTLKLGWIILHWTWRFSVFARLGMTTPRGFEYVWMRGLSFSLTLRLPLYWVRWQTRWRQRRLGTERESVCSTAEEIQRHSQCSRWVFSSNLRGLS